jgi:hypothetical protein
MSEYANKELMLEQISKHRELYYAAKEAGIEERDRPKPPNELIKTFYRMIDGIGSRHNFNGYPFLDIMKSEAIIACYRKAHCFDPSKSSNPFGYFSKVIWQEFTDVIKKEKFQSYIKAKSIHMSQSFTSADEEDVGEEIHEINLANSYFDVDEFERKNNLGSYKVAKERVKKTVVGPLDELFAEDEEEKIDSDSESEDDIKLDDEESKTIDFNALGEEVLK